MGTDKMKYRVTYQDECKIEIVGDFDTLAQAEKALREKAVEIQAVVEDHGLNFSINWNKNNKGFIVASWEGETEYSITYRECTCMIAAVDESGKYYPV